MSEVAYARSGDAHIAYRVIGGGDVDILFGSFGTISFDAFDRHPRVERFVHRLTSFARVILWDRRGVGLSDPYAEGPTMETEAADALAVLDATDSDRAAIVGMQMFVAASILFAASNPDRTAALILSNGTSRIQQGEDWPWGIPRDRLERFLDAVGDPPPPAGVPAKLSTGELLAPSLGGDESFRRWYADEERRGAGPSFAKALAVMGFEADVRSLLPAIRVPTLVFHSRRNPMVQIEHARYLAEHIPGARYVEMDSADIAPFGEIADVMLDEIEEFLTGTISPVEADRALRTVLYTDIVSSTDRMSTLGDSGWRELIDHHDAMVRRQIQRFGGIEIKTMGDGFLVTFDGPALAIKCALAVRGGVEQLGIQVRAGVHTGEVELRGNDVAGIAVNIGQRVQQHASAGEVLVSRTVTDLVAGSGLEFDDRGEHELKGVPGRWQLYAVKA